MAHGDITHVEIPVASNEAAAALYADLFGWQIAEAPGFEGYPMWSGPNGVSGGALVARDNSDQPVSYVEVDSIDPVLEKVTAAGGKVLTPRSPITPTSWFAIFSDPDGNVLGVFEGEM